MISRRLYSTLILFVLLPIAAGVVDSRSGALSAQGIGAADYATTVNVLEQKSAALNERFESTSDCAYIGQQRSIVDATIILANGEDDMVLVNKMLQKKKDLSTKCTSSMSADRVNAAVYRVTGAPDGKGAASGCSAGLIAELMTLDPTVQKDYIAATGLDFNSSASIVADYVIFDMSGGEGMPNLDADLAYIDAQCPDNPGVNGIVLSYFLMNDSERRDWTTSIPTNIAEQVNGWLPTTQQLPLAYPGDPNLPIYSIKLPIYTQEPLYWRDNTFAK